MKTVVVSFEKRTSTNSPNYALDFVNFLNDYTIYVDTLIILSKNDDNGLIEALSSNFDILFILNGDSAGFYVPSVLNKLNLSPDKDGFCGDKKVVSCVPLNFKTDYPQIFERALSTKFNISFGKLTFKLYGISKEEVENVTYQITAKIKSVFFNVTETNGDIKVCLIYGDTAPKKQVDMAVRDFIVTLKKHIYAEDDIPLNQRLIDVAKLRNQKICTAESMTGGLIASKIVQVDGASDVFYEGLVTYNTLAKERRLNVSHSTVNKFSVVSEQVACEMAKGLIEQKNCTLSITITGYAGSSVHPDKDDGLCYIGIATSRQVQVYKYHFKGTRQQNIESAANAALFLAIKTIDNLDYLS